MTASVTGPEIERLIQLLAKLPGLGPRSARRAALHLIKKKDDLLVPLAKAMDLAVEKIVVCSTCGNVDTSDPCTVCTDPRRDAYTTIRARVWGPESLVFHVPAAGNDHTAPAGASLVGGPPMLLPKTKCLT